MATLRSLVLSILAAASFNAGADDSFHTGLNGTWWNADQDGQGFVIHVIPESNQIFVAWFTYASSGGSQMWITGSGSLDESPAQLQLLRPKGGALNATDPSPELEAWGTGTLEFSGCTSGRFGYQGPSSGSIEIERLTPVVDCLDGGGL